MKKIYLSTLLTSCPTELTQLDKKLAMEVHTLLVVAYHKAIANLHPLSRESILMFPLENKTKQNINSIKPKCITDAKTI